MEHHLREHLLPCKGASLKYLAEDEGLVETSAKHGESVDAGDQDVASILDWLDFLVNSGLTAQSILYLNLEISQNNVC